MAAIRALDVDIDQLTVEVCSDDRLDDGVEIATGSDRVLISADLAMPGEDIVREAKLAYMLCRSVAELTAMRLDIVSEGFGTFLIELAGAWASYREWVISNEMPPEVLQRGPLDEPSFYDLGAVVGHALAGDVVAEKSVDAWLRSSGPDTDLKSLVQQTLGYLANAQHFQDVLDFLRSVAEAAREDGAD